MTVLDIAFAGYLQGIFAVFETFCPKYEKLQLGFLRGKL